MRYANAKNNRGSAILIAMTIIMIAVIIIIPLAREISTERRISARLADSVRSFYAAESGMNIAYRDLRRNHTNQDWVNDGWDTSNAALYTLAAQPLIDVNGSTVAFYGASIRNPLLAGPVIESSGFAPTVADVERSVVAEFAEFTPTISGNAITTNGDINQGGSANINGPISEHANFAFTDLFSRPASEIKADPYTTVVNDPPNNCPVPLGDEDITWFVVPSGQKVLISSSTWNGSGVLIVEGDIKLSGGNFEGVLYVIGELDMSTGNADVNGAIFIDCGASDTTDILGTADIAYDQDAVDEALGRQFTRNTWRECNLP